MKTNLLAMNLRSMTGPSLSSCPPPRRPPTYQPPQLTSSGSLGELIRGASWKGVDSTGEIDPENSFPS